jgi:hypothetical protein
MSEWGNRIEEGMIGEKDGEGEGFWTMDWVGGKKWGFGWSWMWDWGGVGGGVWRRGEWWGTSVLKKSRQIHRPKWINKRLRGAASLRIREKT